MTDKLTANHNLPCKQQSAPVPDQWFEMARRAAAYDNMAEALKSCRQMMLELGLDDRFPKCWERVTKALEGEG